MSKTTSSTYNDEPVACPDIRIENSLQTHRPDNLRIYIVRKDSEIVGIQSDILLEAAVFMVEVVRALDTVLEANADQSADLQVRVTVGAQSHNLPDAFMTSNMREFDFCDRIAISTSGGSVFRM
ncbi:oxidoreductase [Aspergillus luchuensis]|uniref:Oxidoreductase n=1 Tax=Aspergillus kawachii TaxID=1069201 RepID=A0A146F8D4_ASPKA|nr:oxidoreductase [Aspergillus luchuensis]